MIAKLANPVLGGLIALLLSVAVGIGLSWRTLNALVDRAILVRDSKKPDELKKRGWDFWTIEIENLSSELKDGLLQLKKRSDALDRREARVAAEEKELAKVRSDLDAIQKQISDRVIEMSADEVSNLKRLAQTYSNLPPEAAVAIFREMDDNTAVKILALMKPDVVAPIFESMSKTAGTDGTLARRAAVLSDKLRLYKTAKPATAP
ncbi:MAG TPA: hypothetical protein VHE61_17845 [Opitutaceae bacterium]|nr:hypothetical protein [Opitutaceae bacterium]